MASSRVSTDHPEPVSPPGEWWKSLEQVISQDARPGNRTIYWYYDPVGNTGKTMFTNYIIDKRRKDVHLIRSIESADVVFKRVGKALREGWTGKIALLDLCNTMTPITSLYQILINLSDGMIENPKGHHRSAKYPRGHVIVFAPFLPAVKMVSKDRWKIFRIHSDGSKAESMDVDALTPEERFSRQDKNG